MISIYIYPTLRGKTRNVYITYLFEPNTQSITRDISWHKSLHHLHSSAIKAPETKHGNEAKDVDPSPDITSLVGGRSTQPKKLAKWDHHDKWGWETISTKHFETTNQVGLELAMCYWQKLRQTQDLICEFEGTGRISEFKMIHSYFSGHPSQGLPPWLSWPRLHWLHQPQPGRSTTSGPACGASWIFEAYCAWLSKFRTLHAKRQQDTWKRVSIEKKQRFSLQLHMYNVRVSLKMGGPPNHPKLDHFSIETHGFEVVPF